MGATAPHPKHSALFLHSFWRSGGTWVWGKCRESPHARAFYEPLHEQAGSLTARRIAGLRPGAWQSNHSDTQPYFQEYARHLRRWRSGVANHQSRFAFDDFFLPRDAEDPKLSAYIGQLLQSAEEENRVAVLKFCRSIGRVAWFERQFPQAMHVVMLRSPVQQWASCRSLMLHQRNRYFATTPLVVLARNMHNPMVREILSALQLCLPKLESRDIHYAMECCWQHLRGLDDAAQYRVFLAFWASSVVAALQSNATIIDFDQLSTSAAYQLNVENMIGACLGHPVRLGPVQPGSALGSQPSAALLPGQEAAHVALITQLKRLQLAPQTRSASLAIAMLQVPHFASHRPVALPRQIRVQPATVLPRGQWMPLWSQIVAARLLKHLRAWHGAIVWKQRAAHRKRQVRQSGLQPDAVLQIT